MPPVSERISWVKAPDPGEVDPQALVRDPEQLAAFFEKDPRRLSAERLRPGGPELARMLSSLLLRANETFLAERLLRNAVEVWPERVDLVRAWARVLLSLGRPDAARRTLEPVVVRSSEDPTARYLLARAYLAVDQKSPGSQRRILAELEAVLRLSPSYKDTDGVGAKEIQAGIDQIKKNLAKGPPSPPGRPQQTPPGR